MTLLLLALPAAAAEPAPPLWQPGFVAAHGELTQRLEAAGIAADVAAAVTLARPAPAQLTQGATFSARLPDGATLDLTLTQVYAFANGDRGFSARAPGATLSLTYGDTRLFGTLERDGASFDIAGVRRGAAYAAFVYRPAGANRTGARMDALSLDVSDEVAPFTAVQVAALYTGSSADGLALVQSSRKAAYYSGEAIDVTVELRNTGASTLTPGTLQLDSFDAGVGPASPYYDLIRSYDIVAVPEGCQLVTLAVTGLAPRERVECAPGSIAAGASRRFTYRFQAALAEGATVRTHARLGALVDVRDEVFLYADVLADADGDGLSDYNETWLGTDKLDPASRYEGPVIVDVLVLHTAGFADKALGAPETLVNEAFTIANQVYADSKVGIVARPVQVMAVDHPDAAGSLQPFDDLAAARGAFADVATWRALYGADLVTLLSAYESDSTCGRGQTAYGTGGNLARFRDTAYFSVVSFSSNCRRDTLVHELAHNMGIAHSRRQNPEGGAVAHAVGFGIDRVLVDIMAERLFFAAPKRVGIFSSPRNLCDGRVCGVDPVLDPANGADSASVLDQVRFQVAAHLPLAEPLALKSARGTTVRAEAVLRPASATMAAQDAPFPRELPLDLHAGIEADPAHVGKPGAYHAVLFTPATGFLQFTAAGRVLPWDGRIASLESLDAPATIAPLRLLDLLRTTPPAELGLAGEVQVFVGYSIDDGADLIYTGKPFTFRVE